jgi:hypothetical protein
MAHPFRHFRVLLCMLLAAALCAACAAEVGEALPLETYQDPGGRFTLSIPKGWQAESSPDGSLLTLTPPDYAGAETELRVLVYISPTTTRIPANRSRKLPLYSNPSWNSTSMIPTKSSTRVKQR